MRRFITVIAAAALLLSILAFPAAASGTPRFYLEGPASARPGERITISVNASGTYSAHTVDMRIFFDNTSLRYIDYTSGTAQEQGGSAGGLVLVGITKENDAVTFGAIMPNDPMTATGTLFKINFEVLNTASPNVPLSIGLKKLSYMPIGASIETPIQFTTGDLTISVQGGSGSGTTSAPAMTPTPINTPAPHTPTATPKTQTGTPKPISTPRPANTQGPGSGRETTRPTGGGFTPDKSQSPSGEKTPGPGATPYSYQTAAPAQSGEPASATDAPAETDAPTATDVTGDVTSGPEVPGASDTAQPEDPNATGGPGASGEPNSTNTPAEGGESSGLKTGLIIGGCVLAAGLAGLCAFLGIKAKKNSKKE